MPGGESHVTITDAMIDVDSPVDEDLLQYLRDNPYALYQGVATAPALDFKTKKTVTFNSDLTPSQITANQNDYNPTGLDSALRLRLDTDASRTITGLAGGASGRVLVIANIGSFDLVLADESASSSAANRFHLESSTDVTISEGGARIIQYDSTLSRWILWGGGSGGSGIGSLVEDTTPQLGGALDTNSKPVYLSKGADVASATALTLGTDGNSFDITGTTTITSINTWAVGSIAYFQFDGALTLTHHATNLVLPSGANITTAAGDHAIMHEYASGTWRCIAYTKADGTALAGSGISNIVEDTTPQLGGPLDSNSQPVYWSKGSDVASATALTLATNGNYFDVTGTTAITSINTWSTGAIAILQFDAALTLTYHATNLILPTTANITTAAGDHAIMHEYGSGTWRCIAYQRADGTALAGSGGLGNIVEDTTPQLGGTLDTNSKSVFWSKGADVASGASLALGTDGNYFDVTGTTTITSINTWAVGGVAVLQFDGILTFTHHATNLILPTGANITTAAGDHAIMHEYAAGTWRCVTYQRADGTALAGSGGLSNIVEDTTPQLGGTLDTNSKSVYWSKGADVASGAALALGTDGNYFDITGTTSITSINTWAVGGIAFLQFDAALTFTHHATNLILPSGANITTAAGDHAVMHEYAAGTWRCIAYTKADGTALVGSANSLSFSTTQTLTAGNYDDWNLGGVSEDVCVIDTAQLFPQLTGISVSQSDGDVVRIFNEEASSGNTGLIIRSDSVAESTAANRIQLPNQREAMVLGPKELIEFIYDGDNSRWEVLSYTGDFSNQRPIEVDLTEWNASEAVSAGDIRIPTTDNGYYYECTTAGTTNGTEPATWSTTEHGTTSDNTVTWTTRRPNWGLHYFLIATDRTADFSPYETSNSHSRMWINSSPTSTQNIILDIWSTGTIDGRSEYTVEPGDTLLIGSEKSGGGGEIHIYLKTPHSAAPDIIIENQQTSGTGGGTATSGAWRLYTLNTEVRDVNSDITLSSSQFTLVAGTWYIEFSVPFHRVDDGQARLYNSTDAASAILGTSVYASAGSVGDSFSSGADAVTITASKTFQMEYRNQSTRSSNGLGDANGWGTEVYGRVKIWRIS